MSGKLTVIEGATGKMAVFYILIFINRNESMPLFEPPSILTLSVSRDSHVTR